MEKRVVIFLVLSIAVILGYDLMLKQFGLLPQSTPVQDKAVQKTPMDQEEGGIKGRANDDIHPPAVISGSSDSKQGATTSEPAVRASDRTVAVETDLLRVSLDPHGGVIARWELKRYRTAPPEQKLVELVHQGAKFRGPLTINVANASIEEVIREGLFSIDSDFARLDAGHPIGHVTMRFQDSSNGLKVQKQLTFHHGSYVVDVAITLEGISEPYEVVLGTNFGIVEWGDGLIGLIGSASLVDGKVEKETPDSELERKGAVQWVALQDKYFHRCLDASRGNCRTRQEGGGQARVRRRCEWLKQAMALRVTLQLYAGPKEYDTLRSLHVGLEDTIDFGWFIFGSWSVVKAVAKPIFYVLRFINEYTPNYGVTIILLTLGIKFLFVPLQYKSYKSMKMMRLIQPKINEVQEKLRAIAIV